ncbi:MAG TPA: immunoglobulin-like domain-containing protein [Longimicrobiaceae bacterium]|nr:immunoglobulin-like domain-containing protein [Longimicrobiaceae bacterium]
MHVPWILALASVLAACTPALQESDMNPELALTVEPDAVRPADTVTLTLRNGTAAEVGYNLCSSTLERRADGAWQTVPSDRICTRELRILMPGQEASYPLELQPGLAPGEYRFSTGVEQMTAGGRQEVASEPFQVRTGAAP